MKKLFLLLLLCVSPAFAQYKIAGPVCDPITGCPAAITLAKFGQHEAFWISDGKTKALVVPALGRVMNYSELNGDNWLWNAELKNGKPPVGDWPNWGGDKTWIGPQSQWPQLFGKKWPPFEGTPFSAEVVSGGKLHTVSEVSPQTGARIIRDYWHDDKTGDFIIQQSIEQIKGAPFSASIWSVSQVALPDAVFIPLDPNSAYENHFSWMDKGNGQAKWKATETLLTVRPTLTGSFKIGADAPVSSIAAVKDGVAFVQKTARPDGDYPDGATIADAKGAGFPVELYNGGTKNAPYVEMELLSPLRAYHRGARWIHTMRWRLHQLPLHDVESEAVQSEVERLLTEK